MIAKVHERESVGSASLRIDVISHLDFTLRCELHLDGQPFDTARLRRFIRELERHRHWRMAQESEHHRVLRPDAQHVRHFPRSLESVGAYGSIKVEAGDESEHSIGGEPYQRESRVPHAEHESRARERDIAQKRRAGDHDRGAVTVLRI